MNIKLNETQAALPEQSPKNTILKQIELCVGNYKVKVNKAQLEFTDNGLLKINSNLSSKLNLPAIPYRYETDQDNRVYLGPVVGILTSNHENKKSYPRGRKEKVFKEIISSALKQGILVFYFLPEGFDPKSKYIKGYSMDSRNRWYGSKFPIPNIVYNRVLYRYLENMPSIKNILTYFSNSPETYLFNSRYLDKWEVHQALSKNPESSVYLPETDLLNKIKLTHFLNKYPEVLIKPRRSSKGQGITKLIRTGPHRFIYSQATKSRGKWKPATKRYITSGIYRIQSNYLLQESIKLAKFNNNIFDIRAQAQKNSTGNWVFTGAAVRVAAKNAFVTHIPNGGTGYPLDDILEHVFINSENIAAIKEDLSNLACIIPPILEKELKINLGIVSLDIGIDEDGRLWLLEVNSKPASFDEDSIRRTHVEYLIEYFVYAAKTIR